MADGGEVRFQWPHPIDAGGHFTVLSEGGFECAHLYLPFSPLGQFDQRNEVTISRGNHQYHRFRRVADNLCSLRDEFGINSFFSIVHIAIVEENLEMVFGHFPHLIVLWGPGAD